MRPWWRLFAGVWLIYLLGPLGQVLDDNDGWRQALGVFVILVFCALYLAWLPDGLRWNRQLRPAVPWILLGLAVLLMPFAGESALVALVFVAVTFISIYPRRVAVPIVLGLLVLAGTLPYVVPGWSDDGIEQAVEIALAALVVMFMIALIRANAQLRAAREDLAEMAVLAERERFARDLHDVLGHSLTVITKKAELARRLTAVDPERAAAEIADVERLSREGLRDLRATVTGVREATLSVELVAAAQALAAAGIDADLPADVPELSPERRVLFGWAVREGVTNVLRHSGARHCRITVEPDRLEVLDDGTGRVVNGTGQGLRGLTERAAAVGGEVAAAPAAAGGFRLTVSVTAP
jgi:two-component system sensor histidine kinase DesK